MNVSLSFLLPVLIGVIASLSSMAATLSDAHGASVTIDFQSLEHVDNLTNNHSGNYYEDGFSVVASRFNTVGTQYYRYSGSTALYNTTDTDLITVRKTSGDTFSIASIDLSSFNSDAIGIVFKGTYADGTYVDTETIYQGFLVGGDSYAADTFYFNSLFSNLVKLEWHENNGYHQFDNLVMDAPISAIPLPPSAILLGTALFGLGAISRRRKKKAA